MSGSIVWLTGLPGSGKTTIADALQARLRSSMVAAVVLDGDAMRAGLSADLGFSADDRRENARRAVEVARLLASSGIVAIVAMISPYAADRAAARDKCGPIPFVEVHVDAPIEVCRARDPKGLYRRSDAGSLAGLTGAGAPYEAPTKPDARVHTDRSSVADCVQQIVALLVWGRA